jgi:cell wall-associated NlpC family hydrolase
MRARHGRLATGVAAAVVWLAGCVATPPAGPDAPIPPHGVIGVTESHLDPEFWIGRERGSGRLVLDADAIAALNDRLERLDPSVRDLEQLPPTLEARQVREWITTLSALPDRPLFDEEGQPLDGPSTERLAASLALDKIPATQRTRHGLAVRRGDLRTFPTRLRAFDSANDRDIDRFQEHALFPGTPVAIVHESLDREWWFVVSPVYAAWIEKAHIAEGAAAEVFAYTRKTPYLVVTGAVARTVFTPQRPEVSELQLEMGVRVPVAADWPANRPVNGQHPYAAHVIELPIRSSDGSLHFSPALLPRTADVADDYLPLTRTNLLRQSFKFLGERYGWGHSHNARDCSGFVSEVYRSFGVTLPRNTRDQAMSPAIDKTRFTADGDREARLAALRQLEVGDLVFIPRHVMMVIGRDQGVPYVIHDTTGIRYRDASGTVTRVPLNAVAVTPLTPLLLGDDRPIVEGIHSILRIRPRSAP